MNRRQAIKFWGFGALALGSGGPLAFAQTAPNAASNAPQGGPFVLPPLPYANDALEPHIDSATMTIHHDRHHGAYVANCNQIARIWPGIAAKPIPAVLADLTQAPEAVRAGVRNNLGGHWNHTFFWEIMTPRPGLEPKGDLKAAIDAAFGSAPNMIEKINAAAVSRFGSGWAWLAVDKTGKLDIISTANQDTPLELGAKPILGVDVWEHAYYLKYQNRRADYLKSWWSVMNWDKAMENFKGS